MPTITLLGTGTCQIEAERRASSVLLDLDDTYILFDCGHGVAQRLLEAGVRHHQLQHIVLSHFHPDHVSDIVPLLQAGAWSQRDPRTTDIHIYGPPGLQKIIDGLLQIFGPRALQQPSYNIVVHEVTQQHFEIGAITSISSACRPLAIMGCVLSGMISATPSLATHTFTMRK